MNNHVTDHFKWSELACKDGTPYPMKWRIRGFKLCKEVEAIRAYCGGKPIRILSAYRTSIHNRNVGGAKKSQHVQGRAIDLNPPRGMNVEEFYQGIKAIANNLHSDIWGVGRYPTFVHIDIRPCPAHKKIVCWRGKRVWAELKG